MALGTVIGGLLHQLYRPGGRRWWNDSMVRAEYEEDFLAWVEGLLREREKAAA